MAMMLRSPLFRSMTCRQVAASNVATRSFADAVAPIEVDSAALAAELNDNAVPTFDLVAELNAKHPEKNIRWAGANTWRTLEWMLPHPPPFHTFEEQPIIKETVGAATETPRPPAYDKLVDPFDHSYHPGTHQTL